MVYRVNYDRRRRCWAIRSGTETLYRNANKTRVLAIARSIAHQLWHGWNTPSQLVVHRKDGDIQYESAYGDSKHRARN